MLGALAAGELEDLIEYHGPAFIGRIERQAGRDPRFRRLLCGVWRSSTPQVWARILAASDGNFNEVPQRAMWSVLRPAGHRAAGRTGAWRAATADLAQTQRAAEKVPARIVKPQPPRQARQGSAGHHVP
ncbi:DUF6869 domain-containing protein [Cupriavidus basilensis]